ncbi:hypothetical protein [Symmachiella dynata]|uniref:hypothetical protein n=1 Tax=Symmachiella dynata TaxID=2527995 RepID=UPI0011A9B72A|nr:hypothetical protein [Symmachiella dynata]
MAILGLLTGEMLSEIVYTRRRKTKCRSGETLDHNHYHVSHTVADRVTTARLPGTSLLAITAISGRCFACWEDRTGDTCRDMLAVLCINGHTSLNIHSKFVLIGHDCCPVETMKEEYAV